MESQTHEQTQSSTAEATGVRAILLLVRARALYEKSNGTKHPSKKEKDDNTKISDIDHTATYGSMKENFTTDVGKKEAVVWTAEVASPQGDDAGYSINLLRIEQKQVPGNSQFFKSMPLRSDNLGVITGIVKNDPNLDNKYDDYDIVFTITDPKSKVSNEIVLDPKLRLDPRR